MNLLSKRREGRLLDGATTGTQMPPRVSIGGNRFSLIDPSGARIDVPFLPDGPALDVIFVDRNVNMSKLYWGKKYDPSEISAPLCWSDNGTAPSALAQEPQSPTCMTCKQNIIGSDVGFKGTPIKACGDLKKFAVVVRGFPGVYLFTITPGSFKAWTNYTNWLRMQKAPDGGAPDLADALVRIRFVGQGLLSFEAIEHITDDHEMAEQVINVWEHNKVNDITGMMVGRFDQPAQGVLPAPGKPGVPGMLDKMSRGEPLAGEQPPPPPPQPSIFMPTAASLATQVAEKKRARTKRPEETRAPIAPAQPVAPAQQGSPPSDISKRLESLFKLPPA